MRKIFQYSALFYFVFATQCQSMDSGATIAVEPSFVGGNPATWSPINKLDTVAVTAEPTILIDPAMEKNVFLTKEAPMEYAATAMDSAPTDVTTQVDPKVEVDPIPMAMMMRGASLPMSATPLAMVKRTAAAAPKAMIIAGKKAAAGPKATIIAGKKAAATPKPQAKPITFMKSNRLIGF